MNVSKVNALAGKRLKAWREKLHLSTREVQAMSRQIATEKQNEEFFLSHNWVTDIENGRFRPGQFRMYAISVIYGRNYTEVSSLFGLQIGDLRRDMASIHRPKTHLLESLGEPETEAVSLPVEFKPDFRFEKTNLLARAVEKWEAVPLGLLQHLDLRTSMYGYIGLEDFTLYPLIRPGSLVQIDSAQRKISPAPWKTDFDRPIYFTELRDGYVCSWCEIDRGRLMVIPHAHAHQDVRVFEYPAQAEIVGRVTGVAMRIVGDRPPEARKPSREK
jgi:transcriptional regulator with XRE-family HTH domain